jgi:sulfur carrier protein
MMEIELNGAPHRVAENMNVHGLVEKLQLGDEAIAIAINKVVVPRGQWLERVLQPFDRVDIVRAIGGG